MGISICRLSLLIHCGPYSAISLPRSRWHCEGKRRRDYNHDTHVFACMSVYEQAIVCTCACYLALKWYMMGLRCPPNQWLHSPPFSFYRKLIGSCHWCVKLLCVGHCRQLDYLFFILSILEQLPCALLLFLNEISFLSVAATVRNCFKK